jgi:hypothetical protein
VLGDFEQTCNDRKNIAICSSNNQNSAPFARPCWGYGSPVALTNQAPEMFLMLVQGNRKRGFKCSREAYEGRM